MRRAGYRSAEPIEIDLNPASVSTDVAAAGGYVCDAGTCGASVNNPRKMTNPISKWRVQNSYVLMAVVILTLLVAMCKQVASTRPIVSISSSRFLGFPQ